MLTFLKRHIQSIGLLLLAGILLGLVYEFWVVSLINDWKVQRIEKSLQENFYEHQEDFQALFVFSQSLKRLDHVAFRPNEQLSFQVSDSLLDPEQLEVAPINIGDAVFANASDVAFLDSNRVQVITGDQNYTVENWVITFEGSMTQPIVEKLLSYHQMRSDQLRQLRKKMVALDCSSFNKNDQLVAFRYRGHWGEGFNYLFPLTDTLPMEHWHPLAGNYYWEHYKADLFCGTTHW